MVQADNTTTLGLDIGSHRTGVAVMDNQLLIARPPTTLDQPDNVIESIAELVTKQHSTAVVVGLPRNLNGDPTSQTEYVTTVTDRLKQAVTVPIYFMDEALTSVRAKAELDARRKPYAKAEIDKLAATYILEDYVAHHRKAAYA